MQAIMILAIIVNNRCSLATVGGYSSDSSGSAVSEQWHVSAFTYVHHKGLLG